MLSYNFLELKNDEGVVFDNIDYRNSLQKNNFSKVKQEIVYNNFFWGEAFINIEFNIISKNYERRYATFFR